MDEELNVRIRVQMEQFKSGIKEATSSLTSFQNKVKEMNQSIQTAGDVSGIKTINQLLEEQRQRYQQLSTAARTALAQESWTNIKDFSGSLRAVSAALSAATEYHTTLNDAVNEGISGFEDEAGGIKTVAKELEKAGNSVTSFREILAAYTPEELSKTLADAEAELVALRTTIAGGDYTQDEWDQYITLLSIVDSLHGRVEELGISLDELDGSGVSTTTDTINKATMTLEEAAQNYRNAIQDMTATPYLYEYTDAIKEAYTTYQQLLGQTSSPFLYGLGEDLKQVQIAVKDAGNSFLDFGTIVQNTIRRLPTRLLTRMIMNMLTKIKNAISEGMQNLYQWEAATNNLGNATSTLDTYTTAVTQAKNAMATALAPVLASIVPMIQAVANGFAIAANWVSAFFAVLTGASTYTKVNTDYAKKYADAIDNVGSAISGAGSAAAEAKRQVMGFDELNVLNSNVGSSGGGSGGSSSVDVSDYLDMFDTGDVASVFSDKFINAINAIKQAIRTISVPLSEVKGYLVQMWDSTIGDMFKSIDTIWNADGTTIVQKIIASAFQIVTDGMQGFFNVILAPINLAGQAIGVVIDSIFGTQLTKRLADSIEENNRKWDEFQDNTVAKILDIKDSFQEFTDNIKRLSKSGLATMSSTWQTTTGKVKSYIAEIGVKAGLIVNDAINEFSEFSTFAKGVFGDIKDKCKEKWDGVISDTQTLINDVISKLDGLKAKAVTMFTSIGKSVASGIGSAMNSAISTIQTVINRIIKAVNNVLSNINRVITKANRIANTSFSTIGLVSEISIQRYATGGFPEDGLFYANHNELVGQFNNGRTAVANNQQIISGIEAGVYNAMMRASNNNQNITVNVDGKSLFDIMVNRNNSVVKSTGRTPLLV